ncbi:MAG: hypothetical protein V7731_01180 [Amphritea sp.]
MSTHLINLANAGNPYWFSKIHKFDELTIQPCRAKYDKGKVGFICQKEPDEAECWTVYGMSKTGDVEWLQVFATEQKGRDFAHQLLNTWPHLKACGLLG